MSLDIDKISARLGSIAPSRMATFPLSVKRLLEDDMPQLINLCRKYLTRFEARVDYADCINTLVSVEGTVDDGITAVYAIGPGHVGESIMEALSDRQIDDLAEQMHELIAEEAGDRADRVYDEMRDRKLLGEDL